MSFFQLSPAEWSAVRLSVSVAAWALALSLVPGILCGWVLARKAFRGKSLVNAIVHLPLVLPPVVTGYVLLRLFGSEGVLGRWLLDTFDLRIAFTWRAAVLAAAVMGFPLLVRSVRLGVELVDRRLEQAASTLGSSPWRVLGTITLPLALPGILTGAVLAFARSLGEFGATITFAGNLPDETRTLPLSVFVFLQQPGGDAAAMRLVVISVVLSLGALLASEILARRVSYRLGHH